MKTSLMMNFSVDRENRKIMVNREFAAPVAKVWAAWTESEYLDQWWAPKPWRARTKSMDFREGGYWLYAMLGPEGEVHWARSDYQTIQPEQSFSALDAFCDENGVINESMARSKWTNSFNESGDSTLVAVEINFDKVEDLEKMIEMGFKEGFTMGMENLDELIANNVIK